MAIAKKRQQRTVYNLSCNNFFFLSAIQRVFFPYYIIKCITQNNLRPEINIYIQKRFVKDMALYPLKVEVRI